jgi:hypothetical protein
VLQELEIKTWLGLAAVGAIISTTGAILGILIKDLVLARAFENWKIRNALKQVYQKYRDPTRLAARELASRILEILNDYPTAFFQKQVLESRPERQEENSVNDPYFKRYKLVSTVYRLSSFLAWLELYRQEITFLHPGNNKQAKLLEEAVEKIRCDLADGHLNNAPDWPEWRDTLIFREELRAIGESLIESRGNIRTVMGYSRYCEYLESSSSNVVERWFSVALNFLMNLQSGGKDFRLIRLQRIFIHLLDLIRTFNEGPLDSYFQQAYELYLPKIKVNK